MGMGVGILGPNFPVAYLHHRILLESTIAYGLTRWWVEKAANLVIWRSDSLGYFILVNTEPLRKFEQIDLTFDKKR